jgi:two-component system chemotaxis response regulator CheY
MIALNDELAREYLAECSEHMATIETDLAAIEKGGATIDEELVKRVFRAIHSVRGARFFDLVKIGELAHSMEDVLGLIHSRQMHPTLFRLRVLRRAGKRLQELIQSPQASNDADISEIAGALERLKVDHSASIEKRPVRSKQASDLQILLVEDDFASQLLMRTFLARFGACDVVVNGREAVQAFRTALEGSRRYDLICMDIMMPEMDGREAMRQVRDLEEAHGIFPPDGTKIFMTTAVSDRKEVIRCFQDFCDAYIRKPIDLANLLRQMKAHQLLQ